MLLRSIFCSLSIFNPELTRQRLLAGNLLSKFTLSEATHSFLPVNFPLLCAHSNSFTSGIPIILLILVAGTRSCSWRANLSSYLLSLKGVGRRVLERVWIISYVVVGFWNFVFTILSRSAYLFNHYGYSTSACPRPPSL